MSIEEIINLNIPVIISTIILLFFAGLLYLIYIHFKNRIQKIHKLENEKLELENTQLTALFTELNPDPVFMFNKIGEITFANHSGLKLCNSDSVKNLTVNNIFPEIKNLDFKDCIENSRSYSFTNKVKNSYFDIRIKSTPEMEFGQIYCNDITQRLNAEKELKESREKLRELSQHNQQIQEEEKQKISRELHDSFGQILTSIKLNLELLKENSDLPEDRLGKIETISFQVEEAMTEIKEISYRLKPRVLDDFGIVPSIKSLCNKISKESGIKGDFFNHKINGRLEPAVETGLYRITQEALNNIIKHSSANEFSIQLVKHPGMLRLMIEDDGIGFEPEIELNSNNKKMGLKNMEERAIAINGSLVIDSKKGAGTEIIVEIPLKENNEKN